MGAAKAQAMALALHHRDGRHGAAALLLGCALLLGRALAPAPLLAQAPPAPGQEPAAPGRAPSEQFVRLSFLELSQYSYLRHPFFQITGDTDFRDGDAVSGFSNVETPTTASDENILLKAIHTLPPFGVETGFGINFIYPKAITIGVDYSRFSQTDKQALDTTKSLVTIPRIQMDTYLYSVFVRGYAFDTNEPGMNFYIGFGQGILEGKFDAVPFSGASKERVGFQQTPVGITQLGAESFGTHYGLRYEVRVVRARKVRLDRNPYQNQETVTEIDFSGTLIKISIFYQF
jgi:hypothetical protein